MEKFQQLYDAGKEKDNYDLQLLTDQRYAQRQASIHENPYFVNAPFSGIVGKCRHLQDIRTLLTLYSKCCGMVFRLSTNVKQD